MRRLIVVTLIAAIPASAVAQPAGNLLRNGEFQDDWITFLPETKNHHWCFPSEFFNRRDYNPDGWYCKGAWDWHNADAPWGQRRIVVSGPAELYQRVNWIAIHDDRQLGGFPDAGGFPVMKVATSKRRERLARDLAFRVKLAGTDVPKGAGALEVGLHPPTGLSPADPMGDRNPATVAATVSLPEGTFKPQWIEVKLPAADWWKKAKGKGDDVDLPAIISVAIRYAGKTGKLDVERAELLAAPSDAPNLLANGGFESLDKADYPTAWSKPMKYTYFPPRHYYIFNTWHNTSFPNRGTVEIDKLLVHAGKHSLRMIVPPGDETCVVSDPIALNQKEPRLIEVTAWIKTDRLCMLQIDGHDEKGNRLDGFNFIHKAPVSIGTDSWRMIRQVVRPRTPVQSLKLVLAARGVNGYTLDDTGHQPQNNVVGHIWWDDVRVSEPEALAKELEGRGVKAVKEETSSNTLRIVNVDLGERLQGRNVARIEVENTGPATTFAVQWATPVNVKVKTNGAEEIWNRIQKSESIAANSRKVLELPYDFYEFSEPPRAAYMEMRAELWRLNDEGKHQKCEIWLAGWTTPIKLDLGALYLRPEQKQFVRMNLGFTQATMAKLKSVRLEVVRPGTEQVLKTVEIDASPKAILAQRAKIPTELRDDFANLLLADLDVSFLPVQPFAEPRRSWIIRASAITSDGKTIASADSPPFCRLAHDAPQPAIKHVAIKNGMTYINGQPWMPFGVCYGHTPVYDGPADSGKYRDLRNLPGWSMYDRHHSTTSNRKQYDFNCLRYVAGSISKHDQLDKRWTGDNLYCSSAFAIPQPAFSLDELFKQAGGRDKLDAYLQQCKTSPSVVSIAPGIEEAFGLFQGATPKQIQGMQEVVEYLRKQSGRPVMLGHGGYWNRLEFEKAPFFDIYDPETEPLYPANLHTDLTPLVAGKNKVIWLRPQMYESIPYERWRFHTYVELMRGCRGWQIAHGPGDPSLFRGLHGEMEFWKPVVASMDAAPKLKIEPWIEHKAWKHQGKTYLIAATTRGIPFGVWESRSAKVRLTEGRNELRDETNAYGIGTTPESGVATHGLQYLPDAKAWPKGTKLVQEVMLDSAFTPSGMAILVKADGRWTHAATWGKFDLAPLKNDPKTSYWFLNTFYRHAKGFLGWGTDLVPKSLDYIPAKATAMGELPKPGAWHRLEVPLDQLGATDKLLDGVGFMHDGGKVGWSHTTLVGPDGKETRVWGDSIELPPSVLKEVKIHAEGLKAGTKVRVLFEDREIVAKDGYFIDDFRGQDLYQRHGGRAGYGNAPVALHAYAIP